MSTIGDKTFTYISNEQLPLDLNNPGVVQRSDSSFSQNKMAKLSSMQNSTITSSDSKLRGVAKNDNVQVSDTQVNQDLVDTLSKISGSPKYKLTKKPDDRRKMINNALDTKIETGKCINDATLGKILEDKNCTRGVKAALLESDKLSLSQKDRILSNYSEEIIAYADKYNFELCGHSNYDMDGFIYQIEDFIKNPDSNIDLSSFRYDKFYDNQKVAIFGYIITIKSEENSQIRLKSEALKTLMNISHLEENTTELKGINFVKSRMKKILNEISKEPNAETRKMYLGDLNKLFEKCEEFYTPSQISSIKNEETKKFFDDMKEFFNKQNNFLKGEIGQLESSRDCGSFETLSGEDICKRYDEMFSEGSPKQSI